MRRNPGNAKSLLEERTSDMPSALAVENGMVSIRGAIDLHVHSGPSLFGRIFDDIEMAQQAAATGLQAVLIKNHFESTVGRARLASKVVPEVKVFGGLVLNTWTGGFNPVGVEAKILLGGKAIWMPTTTAANHVKTFGSGTYVSGGKTAGPTPLRWSARMNPAEGLSVLNGTELHPEVKEIVRIVAEHNVILGTSHLSKQEIFALVRYAREVGARKVLITHPYWQLPNFSLDELEELVEIGAYADLVTICHVSPTPVPIELLKKTVDVLGAERLVITSDCGAPMFPKAVDSLRLVAQWLYQAGVSEVQLGTMMRDLPKSLLDI
jgi:hypothetical protein